MQIGRAPIASTPVASPMWVIVAAAGGFIPIIGRGPGMALVGSGGLAG